MTVCSCNKVLNVSKLKGTWSFCFLEATIISGRFTGIEQICFLSSASSPDRPLLGCGGGNGKERDWEKPGRKLIVSLNIVPSCFLQI